MNMYVKAAQSFFLSLVVIAVAVFLTPHRGQLRASQPTPLKAPSKSGSNPSENTLALKNSFKEAVLNNKKPVVVNFFAEWCPTCNVMKPVFDEVAKEFKDIQFVLVDIDQFEEIASNYTIQAVPTFLFFKNGVMLNRSTGFLNKEQLTAAIKKEFSLA